MAAAETKPAAQSRALPKTAKEPAKVETKPAKPDPKVAKADVKPARPEPNVEEKTAKPGARIAKAEVGPLEGGKVAQTMSFAQPAKPTAARAAVAARPEPPAVAAFIRQVEAFEVAAWREVECQALPETCAQASPAPNSVAYAPLCM